MGRTLPMTGDAAAVTLEILQPDLLPARRAMAMRWMMALVEQPMAMATAIAFSKAGLVWIFCGVRSSHTISTMRRPHSEAKRM